MGEDNGAEIEGIVGEKLGNILSGQNRGRW